MRKNFIIFSAGYDEKVGGLIVLHRLCDLLNREGQKAFVWPFDKPVWDASQALKSTYRIIRYWVENDISRYKVFDKFITPIAKYSDFKNSIVIYPEIVNGNPLLAKNIVRWFLHKPGYHTGIINYGKNELYFYYQKAFNDEELNLKSKNLLQTVLVRDDIYYQKNHGPREGTCYILKKGKDREIVHDIKTSILIDNMTHEEIAEVFNRVEMCISYDLYTMYSRYAAMCGCISVVIPEKGLTKEEWKPEDEGRYGVAYGFEDIDHAVKTQKLVLPTLKAQETNANKTVKKFIKKCESYFMEN